ncbi:MAG: class I SAM-dependent methyltransferase [Myxococcota bacterium]
MDALRYMVAHRGIAVPLQLGARAFHRVMKPDHDDAPPEQHEFLRRRFEALLERDLANVQRGAYPRDLLFSLPWATYARTFPAVLREVPRVWWRRVQNRFDELPENINRSHHPAYYLRNFHWQSDGWFSERSAGLYDVGVELLFLGAADVMRRMALPPLVENIQRHPWPRVVDVACGTGRFLEQLHRTLPRAKLYGLDLSHPYLAEAGRVLRHVPDVSLMCDSAEHMPFADRFFDAATSIFLLHELPRDARRRVVREAMRVLRPGGVLVVCDSAQLSDGRDIRWFLEAFQELYHEPYYASYLRDDVEQVLRACGFHVEGSESHYLSKVVVARKP